MGRWTQLRLLLWKNYVLQFRRPIGTTMEILVPILAIVFLIIIRRVTDSSTDQGTQCMSTFNEHALTKTFDPHENASRLAYAPANNTDVEFVMEKVRSILAISTIPYLTESEAVKAAGDEDNFIGAVIFTNARPDGQLPDDVAYSIRVPHSRGFFGTSWETNREFPLFSTRGPRRAVEYFSGFVQVEHAVDQGLIALKVRDSNSSQQKQTLLPTLARQFPFPSYKDDSFSSFIRTILPLLIVIAFIYTAGTVVRELVLEKQERLKETMRMMGLANWIHWLAWFIKQFSFNLISVIVMTLLAIFGNVFKESNGFLIFLFFLIFVLAGIAFMFMISTFFSSAKLGLIFGFLLWFASFFPYLILVSPNIYARMNRHTKSLACLFSNMCMGFAASQILNLESKGVGLQTSNIGGTPDDDFSVGQALGMMTLDMVLYFLICWYVEAVFPGKYGIPQPWYFAFTKTYWLGRGNKKTNVTPVEDIGEGSTAIQLEERSSFEAEPTGLTAGIRIKNLRKVFKANNGFVIAVDGISLNMFEDQITALLGHNGAGKTTTMSMLTGLFPPTSGDAIVNRSSIRKDISGVRKSLGLCPQHNLLFDRLTVREHLEFFLSLKGQPKGPEYTEQVDAMLTDLQLTNKAKSRSAELSGGMKRKLSVGIALIGHSQIIILDEPTAGMDPYARRATWDLLEKHKAGRTMLLTTHYMEEADVLGDRIAIMAEGQIRCAGSSTFLKKRYGVGYHLTMVKGEQCNRDLVTKYLMQHIPSVKLNSDVGRELSYLLPRNEEENFPALFESLESEIKAIGIESFGLSQTTLEEVFLRVESSSDETMEDRDKRQKKILAARDSIQSISRDKIPTESSGSSETRIFGCSLWLQQFKAVFVKRFLNSKRDVSAVFSQMLLPIVFTIFALVVLKVAEFSGDDPPLKLSLGNVAPTTGYVSDFANKPQWKIFESAEAVLKSVGVTSVDNLNSSLKIRERISDNVNNKKDCCNNKYLVLNKDCIVFIENDGKDFASDTCADEDFGFNYCTFDPSKADETIKPLPGGTTNCLIFSQSGYLLPRFSLSNAIGAGDSDSEERCPVVPTMYINSYDTSYFMEDILRKSDASEDANVFFEENSCGFTLVDPVTAVNYSEAPSDPERVGVWATVWYSNQPLHTAPAALSALSNMQLRYFLSRAGVGEDNINRFSIEVTNYPLPRSSSDRIEAANSDAGTFILPFLVSFGMAFLSASFVTFPVAEKVSRAKHLQFLSGLLPTGYWLATLTWDFCNYCFPAILILVLFAAFQITIFTNAIGAVILLLILYAWANLPLVYLFSFLFSSPYTGFAIVSLFLVLTSLLGTVLVFVFLIPSIDLLKAAEICRYIFYLQPNYAFSQSLSDLYRNGLLKEACAESNTTKFCIETGVFSEDLSLTSPGIGTPVLFLFFEGILYFTLVLLIEYRFFVSIRDKPSKQSSREDEDEDVKKERSRVLSSDFDAKSSIVVAKELTKQYRKADQPAIDHLTFSIPRGECFGLLGLNGAGKTTTFKILTGELQMSSGTAFIDGLNIRTHLHQVQRKIGYCPQFDSLIERLTGREYLTCIAYLRGYPSSEIPHIVQRTINRLDLEEYADRTCGTYSGGNRRKLSTGIALVGDPSVIFLDEPTAGMDPKARRFLWDCLVDVLKEGRSIVLTSHSMEECEALCTRLGILVNGRFKCLGSIQHLKTRFGSGISLTLLLGDTSDDSRNKPDCRALKSFIQKQLPGARLIDEHGAHLGFNIEGNHEWSFVFNVLEKAKTDLDLNLGSYSVSQTTLEEVFLRFAKEQKENKKSE